MDKRKYSVVAFILIGLIAVTSVIVWAVAYYDYSTVVAVNWNIKMPRNYEIIYSAETEPSFFGDGPRYHIYYYQDGIKDSFIDDFSREKDLDFEAEVDKVLGYLTINQNKLIDFDQPYYWKKVSSPPGDDNLYFIYQGDNKYLYIVEMFL